MGMFGSRGLTASQQVSRGGDGTSMALAKPSGPDWHRIAGIVGDALSGAAGQPGMYARTLAEGHQQQAELQRQMALAQYKQANPDPTGTMQNVAAAGLKPGSPEYQAMMSKVLLQPHYMMLGNPETGQQVIDANNPPAQGGDIDPAAIARLKANPGEAAMFDEHFGPGASAHVLGGQ
jgi:hypothetical protein